MQGGTSHDPQNSVTAPMNESAAQSSQGHNKHPSGRPQIRPREHGLRKSKQVCRFYGSKKGCRAQDQCPYLHVQHIDAPPGQEHAVHGDEIQDAEHEPLATSGISKQHVETSEPTNQNAKFSSDSKPLTLRSAVLKPVPAQQQKDPREFQLSQVVRRFSPSRDDGQDRTVLRFKLQPSDPDFPFELDALECVLTVPASYPKGAKSSIMIENKDIPRGFQINIEKGYDRLSSDHPKKSLLQLLNDLDRNLEKFLTAEKAQTIKIVANKGKPDDSRTVTQTVLETVSSPQAAVPSNNTTFIPIWSTQAKADAKVKREDEIRQLEARMGRMPLFASSNDGISFNVPLQITKPFRLPLPLQPLREATLVVPMLYGLEPCRIQLKGVSGAEVDNAEFAFERRANDHKEMTLMAHINYLTQNLHAMSSMSVANPIEDAKQSATPSDFVSSSAKSDLQDAPELAGVVDEDRPHLRFISHPPPEWNRKDGYDDDESSESEFSDDFVSDDDDSDASHGAESQAGGASLQAPVSRPSLEKGVLLSFPQLELHGVELLEIHSLSIAVKCDRCKSTIDIKNIKPAEPNSISIRTDSCHKCASSIAVSFRSEPMHTNSIKAGYLDLEGCTVVDMLLSQFLPTCSECSTASPLPGIASVRGDSPLSVCRECHHRLNFQIPEVKFLRVASNDPRLHLPLRSKRKKENLGISAGSELPDRGRCKHYAKSYRWFRFSCCGRVYPCDRCHDEKEDHPNEHGNRMICGWCSREQNYRPEDCNVCGRSVIRKTGGGFWEGGKGTRDKVKMNRKDPRKYKRIGGGARGGEK